MHTLTNLKVAKEDTKNLYLIDVPVGSFFLDKGGDLCVRLGIPTELEGREKILFLDHEDDRWYLATEMLRTFPVVRIIENFTITLDEYLKKP